MKKLFVILSVLTTIFMGCDKEDFLWNLPRNNPYDGQINDTSGYQVPNKDAPKLTTGSASNITETTSTVSGDITSVGSSEISTYGHCWSINQMPSISDNKTNLGATNSSVTFTSNLTNLSPNTPYYVRAFATNSYGTSYGNQVSFTTTANINLATLTTTTVSSITQTSVQTGGNITSDGGAIVISRGVCYSTTQNPTTSNSLINSGSGTGSFTSNITGLSPNTNYYVRAFATNSVGTSYGNQVSLTTSQLPNNTCNVTATTTGSTYTMQTPSQPYFNQGDTYTITMYSSIYSFGQADNVTLYDGDDFVYSFGNWLGFTNNTKTFTLPNSIPSSNCYNIRVMKGSDLYVSSTFIIIP
jgi:hypothetical protein